MKKSLWLKFREFFNLKHREVVGLFFILCAMLIAFVFCKINFNHSMKQNSEQNLSENTTIIFEESTVESTTEEKSTTTLSSFHESPPNKSSQTKTSISETSSSSNSSFSSASAITFYYDDGEPVYISTEEYYTICSIVMAESGTTYEGCVAVAQAIRTQIIREKKLGHSYDITSIRSEYQLYYDKKPNDTSRRAVTDVFHNHIVVTREPIIVWVSDGSYSSWHASQIKVGSWGGNTFYKLKNQDF